MKSPRWRGPRSRDSPWGRRACRSRVWPVDDQKLRPCCPAARDKAGMRAGRRTACSWWQQTFSVTAIPLWPTTREMSSIRTPRAARRNECRSSRGVHADASSPAVAMTCRNKRRTFVRCRLRVANTSASGAGGREVEREPGAARRAVGTARTAAARRQRGRYTSARCSILRTVMRFSASME
jgi:hypothetical protein